MTRYAIFLSLLAATAAVAQTAPPAPPADAMPAAPVAPPEAPMAPMAPAAPAAVAAPAAPVAPPLPKDERERVVQICMNEAKMRATKAGATDVTLREVKDTDLKSNGFASMRATVNLITTDKKGKPKSSKKTFGCSTANDIVTSFDYDG